MRRKRSHARVCEAGEQKEEVKGEGEGGELAAAVIPFCQ